MAKFMGLENPVEPDLIVYPNDDDSRVNSICGSVMGGLTSGPVKAVYEPTKYRWVILCIFVIYSASNSMQWTQYTIISNIVVAYYGVNSKLVTWTSMIYMVSYVPLIFPGSWLLDKTVS